MLIPRRAAFGSVLALATPAFGQARFPNRSIRFLIPWPPGGSLDALHRRMFDVFQQDHGQSIVIENVAGARGTRAAIQLVQQARPDGYTLAHHHLSIIRHPFLTRQPTWDPVTDFTYIMQVTGFVFGTVVRSDSPWRSWAELMEATRRRPGELTYSTSGIATTNHIAMESLLEREGGSMTHVPFRGSQEGVTALLGRQIHAISDSQTWREQVLAGQFRALSVWTPTRLPDLPDVPTLKDLGYGISVTSPYGIAGPRGMEPEVVDFLHRALRKALLDEQSQRIMRQWDLPDEYLDPQAYLEFARERTAYEREAVARMNLSID